ncbi:TonB-dependent receptor [Flavobacterium sp. F-65]|uniref:TonB-dependent receptor n=1 Tax=Flavobacterium pisciphilum TaxID=2893755 RepID=A0ABS8MPG5_9FLAO|nr:TonB-dependent receptor [Flavobacterium sp. F-65]MCC9070658.1 TonB-dependent receptor [Flavobacterium sp. F-65]
MGSKNYIDCFIAIKNIITICIINSCAFVFRLNTRTNSSVNENILVFKKNCTLSQSLKFGLLFLCLFFLPSGLLAQNGTLSGILKLENGTPITYAAVAVKNTNHQMITDDEGKFEFKGLAHGHYEIEVSSIEITRKSINVHFKGSSERILLIVEPSASLGLKEVIINVKTEKKEVETKGFAVNVIETQKMALQSIQTNELLDRSAGVRIRQDGGLGSKIDYNINGLSGNAVKVFIDGIPASNFGSSYSLNSIPPALIDRIEVYKGVVPANLSEDALGGAINIILKKKTRNSLVTSYSLGSFNTHQWNIASNYRKENGFTVDASAFYNYSDNNYEVWGKSIAFKDYTGKTTTDQRAKRFHDAYKSYGTKVEVGFTDVKWADRFMIGGILSRDYKEVQHGITMDNVYGDRHTRRNSNIATLTYSKSDLFTKGLSFKLDGSYSYLKRQAIDTVGVMYDWRGKPLMYPDGTYVKYTSGAEVASAKTLGINTDKTLFVRTNFGYEINSNNTVYANYMYNNFIRGISDELEPLGMQLLTNTRDLQKNIVSFTYENLAFSQKLRTNIFYKHYFQKATSNEPYRKDITPGVPNYEMRVFTKKSDFSGYGITLSYELNPNLFLLGSAEKAMRLPSPNELFGNVNDNLLAPAGELKPETSYNANIGVNWSGLRFNEHSIRLNASLFYRDTRGMIRESIRAGSFTYSQFENLENVMSRGIDAEIIYDYAKKFNLSFNVSKFDALFNTKYDVNGAPYLFYRMQIRNEPSFKFNINAVYYQDDLFAKKSKASIYYNISYVDEFLRNWANVGGKNLDYIPTQFSNSIGVAYTFPSNKFTISVDAKNIFDQQIFDNFGLQKPGRAFYAKLTYSLTSK